MFLNDSGVVNDWSPVLSNSLKASNIRLGQKPQIIYQTASHLKDPTMKQKCANQKCYLHNVLVFKDHFCKSCKILITQDYGERVQVYEEGM